MGCPKGGKLKLNNDKRNRLLNVFCIPDTLMIVSLNSPEHHMNLVVMSPFSGETESLERLSDLPKASPFIDGKSKNLDKGLLSSRCKVLSHYVTLPLSCV